MKKIFALLSFLVLSIVSCKKESNTIQETNENQPTSVVARESNNPYFVADYVDQQNVGQHHTSCVRYVLDNLKKISEQSSVINESIINGKIIELMNEYCEINGLPHYSFPTVAIPDTYQEMLEKNNFSSEMSALLTNSFEVFDNYSTVDSMFTALNENLEIANTLVNEDERVASTIAINVLISSLDVWIKQEYNSYLPDNFGLMAGRLSSNDKKVLRKDAIATLVTTATGGFNPLSFCVGMITGTGASIGTWMGQHGYDDSWWPF